MQKTGMEAVRDKIPTIAWLAKQIGVTRGAVSQWDEVPANRVGDVARATGLTPAEIRPDIFVSQQVPQ